MSFFWIIKEAVIPEIQPELSIEEPLEYVDPDFEEKVVDLEVDRGVCIIQLL